VELATSRSIPEGRKTAYNRVGATGTSYTPGGGEHVAKGRSMKKEKKKPKKEKK